MAYHTLKIPGSAGWLLQRLSALYLAAGLGVHFWVCHFAIDKPLTYAKIAERMSSPGWVVFDLSLLAACVYHGFNGVWWIVQDYAPGRRPRRVLGFLLVGAAIAVFAWGAYLFVPLRTR